MKKIIIITALLFSFGFADKVNGWKPIHEAVFADDMNATKTLVERDHCDIDAPSNAGIAPLHIAVKTRNLAMVDYLCDHGADVDVQDDNGYTPLLYAISQRRLKIVESLVRHEADVNLPNDAGITPLQQAAYTNDFDIVDFLLRNGADADRLNKNGVNACELAYLKGNFAMAHHLMSWTRGVCGKYANELSHDTNETEKSKR